MKFYRNADGDLQVDCEGASPVIGSFLIEDIQDSPFTCGDMLEAVTKIGRGETAAWKWVGNAHSLILSPAAAVIESLFDSTEEPCRINLEDFRRIVHTWRQFLERQR